MLMCMRSCVCICVCVVVYAVLFSSVLRRGVFGCPFRYVYICISIQVYVVLLSSVLMGGVFGCSFGLLDVEDDSASHRRFDQVLLGLFCYYSRSLLLLH
jgi:hypothetical protein